MMIDLEKMVDRIIELQVASLASINVTCDAVPRFFHTQESYPYWTNRISAVTYSDDDGAGNVAEDVDFDTYTVTMRLVVGHVTESTVTGQVETVLYQYIPVVKRFFHEREGLQTDTFPTRLDNLYWARITSSTGLAVIANSGIGVQQVCAEFTLDCLFSEYIERKGD